MGAVAAHPGRLGYEDSRIDSSQNSVGNLSKPPPVLRSSRSIDMLDFGILELSQQVESAIDRGCGEYKLVCGQQICIGGHLVVIVGS